MSLLSRPFFRGRTTSRPRRVKVFRPGLHPYLEAMEPRLVLSAPGAATVAAAALQSPITITGLNITNLAVTGANTLLATGNLTGTLNTSTGSQPFTLPGIQIPITLTPTGTTADGCPILHLSLQIPDLNILGLHVQLDNCSNGPVTVDITAIPSGHTFTSGGVEYPGGLLGDVLCGVSNLLSGTGGLLNLGSLTGPITGGQVTGALTTVLNGILTDLTTGTTTAPGGTGGTIGTSTPSTDAIPAGDVSLVSLHIGPINADVLGLLVQTSPICLNVFADPNGGLLGSLLSSLNNLLNNHGNNSHAETVLVRNILRDLQHLAL